MLRDLRSYFLNLPRVKRIFFFLTLLFFITAGTSLAYTAYVYFTPSGGASGGSEEAAKAVSPLGFFGKIARERLGPTGNDPTVENPINGVLYSQDDAKVWQVRRPMAIMVNNHVDARPQWGLSFADLIYEAVAEGGISRFLAVFHSTLPEKVGPVRSARKYYVDFAKEYDAWYTHWGGASTANEANVYDYMRTIFVSSIDEMWVGAGPDLAFDRDPDRLNKVAVEHTAFARPEKLYETAYKQYPDQVREFRPITAWKFKDDLEETGRSGSSSVEFNFWDLPDFSVRWDFDPRTNTYTRSQGGKIQVDALNNEPLKAKNVIIEFMTETALGDEKAHLLYRTLGEGGAKILLDGKVIEARWSRRDLPDRTKYFDESGAEIIFNRGQTWVEILPTGNTIKYN